jgi:peroxiredoxin
MGWGRARCALVVALLATAALAGSGCAGNRPVPQAPTAGQGQGLAAGAPPVTVYPAGQRVAPDPVTGELLDGSRFDLASLHGSVVVLNWWGSWCAPCRIEAKDLVAAFEATKSLGVAFLGVNIRDGRDAAVSFATDFKISYPSLFDPAGRVALAFRDVTPNVIPATVIMDRSGRVAAAFRKVVTRDELEPVIRQVATEAG